MAQNLEQYLIENPSKGFNSVPQYFPTGDFLTFYFRPDRAYSERIDDVLTVYLSIDKDELVGCKIKGVRHILETAGALGVEVDGGQIRLGFFIFQAAATAKSEEARLRLEQLKPHVRDASIDRRELQST